MIPFPPRPALLGLLLIAVLPLPAGAVPAARHVIRDGGQARVFETAVDEFSVRRESGEWKLEKSQAGTVAGLSSAMAARQKTAAAAETVDVVLYETGRPRTEANRRWATPGVLVMASPGTDFTALATKAGAAAWKPAPALEGAAILSFNNGAGAALTAAEFLRLQPGVLSAEPLLARKRVPRWIPNDAYFAYSPTTPGYQWHLRNTGQNGAVAGIDINVISVWDTWRGSGIRIGILDDGVQTTHPDLALNVDTVNDYDWNGKDNDPTPSSSDPHGTCCAGLAAGRGNNGIGICGAAPEATIVGLRLIAAPETDEDEAGAFLHRNDIIQVKSNSWGPDDTGDVVEGPGPLAAAALAAGARSGRGGLGTVVVWAGGNGLEDLDDSNYDGYANSIYVIATGAVTDRGTQAYYSESGANLLITTPSSGNNGAAEITTVDPVGSSGYNSGTAGNFADASYTNDFGGTSAASPIAAGAVALLLQSNPALGWRDVQEILVRTATKVDAGNTGWLTNAAGFHFNNKYGAGLLNTQAAVTLATGWTNLTPMATQSFTSPGGVAIPDNSTPGIVKTFAVPAANFLRVEHAAVTVDITHPRRGQLAVDLISPSGTLCRLAPPREDNSGGLAWTFTTPQFWGESSTGTWTVRVRDTVTGNTGTLNSASLTLYGTGLPGTPALTSASTLDAQTGFFFSFQPQATNTPVLWAATGLPPGLTLNGTTGLISGTPTATGTFLVNLTVANTTGSQGTVLTVSVTEPPAGIPEALDAPAVRFHTAGKAWFAQSTETHDGVDAAQSAALPDNGISGLQTTVTGPVAVTFWWRVSSEERFDKLRFLLDDAEVNAISGETSWAATGLYIPPGTHTLRWSYGKDDTASSGQDAGWLDSLRFHSSIVPLAESGTGTGFQESATGATFSFVDPGSGLGWIAEGGRVAEAGNRYPAFTGGNVPGTTGVQAFEINGTPAILCTDTVDLSGFLNVRGEADVRAFTTNSSGFESNDSLHIYLELSSDAVTWTDGPDILPFRTGGPQDHLITLNTSGTAVYQHFATASGAIPAGTRYARVVVAGVLDSTSEYLVVDNLKITGNPDGVDADGDGSPALTEAWFGTSDLDPVATPTPLSPASGAPGISFPSLPGYPYAVEYSDDLIFWNAVPVTADSAFTVWLDPQPWLARRFYRVRRP